MDDSFAPRGSSRMGSGRFGKYTLVGRIAIGGMADIYFARLEGVGGFQKPLVIKRLLPDLAKEPEVVAMFLDEARLVARISHPNVCQVYELGKLEESYFIAMEYLDGVPLDTLIEKIVHDSSAADLRLVAGLFCQACEGLHHAHEITDAEGHPINLVHRDVSPQNIFATVTGVAKVLDFGIAKARIQSSKTRTGVLKGKYIYMSPEQLTNQTLDRRVDVFALGAVLFEMLTGHPVFARETEFLMFRAINDEERPRVSDLRGDVPPAIDAVVQKALERDRDQRYATARELGEALAEAVAPLGGPLGMTAIATELGRLCGPDIASRRELINRRTALIDSGRHDAFSDDHLKTPYVPEMERTVASGATRRRTTLLFSALGLVAATALAVVGYLFLAGPGQASVLAPDGTVTLAAGPGAAPDGAAGATGPDADDGEPGGAPASLPSAATAPTSVATDASTGTASPALDAGPPPPSKTVQTKAVRLPRPVRRPPRRGSTHPGFFTIDSRPYATIYVDGKKLGVTPLFRVKLSPGRHRVRAVTADKKSKRFTVSIASGRQTRRRLTW